ncbi:MAG: hypothetical protein ACYDBV_08620 [Nitrospiria bacterium]
MYQEKVVTKYYQTGLEQAELLKQMSNSFLAMRVGFFNVMFDLCEKIGISLDDVVEMLPTLSARLTNLDVYVTEQRGFGGACLPKDLNALIGYGVRNKLDVKLLSELWDYNVRIRQSDP